MWFSQLFYRFETFPNKKNSTKKKLHRKRSYTFSSGYCNVWNVAWNLNLYLYYYKSKDVANIENGRAERCFFFTLTLLTSPEIHATSVLLMGDFFKWLKQVWVRILCFLQPKTFCFNWNTIAGLCYNSQVNIIIFHLFETNKKIHFCISMLYLYL